MKLVGTQLQLFRSASGRAECPSHRLWPRFPDSDLGGGMRVCGAMNRSGSLESLEVPSSEFGVRAHKTGLGGQDACCSEVELRYKLFGYGGHWLRRAPVLQSEFSLGFRTWILWPTGPVPIGFTPVSEPMRDLNP